MCASSISWQMLSNAYFLAKFRFDKAENEPTKNLHFFQKLLLFLRNTVALAGLDWQWNASEGIPRIWKKATSGFAWFVRENRKCFYQRQPLKHAVLYAWLHKSRTTSGFWTVQTSTFAVRARYAEFRRHDTSKQFWSGCISLHRASRISCPLDSIIMA